MATITKAVKEVLIVLIRCYQAILRPFTGQCCRFTPVCSSYAIEALQTHGIFHGCLLAGQRLARCHPFTVGGTDPVPALRRKDVRHDE